MPLSIRATILQTPSPGELQVLVDHRVTVGDDGLIIDVSPATGQQTAGANDELVLPDDQVLLPGMIDSHIHAPQWPQLGTGLDLPLEEWLQTYTFPLEARYDDLAFATRVWDSLVPTLLSLGTTTAVYYSSIHEPATVALAEACIANGQRAFVGRVAMDHPDGTPSWYRDGDAAASVEASRRSVEDIAALPGPAHLVQPIITPRFIPACSDAALDGLGELAEATGVRVQTHCSESDWEHGYVLDRHGCTDTESLARFGLGRDHTVLAHATHLTDDDRRTLKALGAGLAHCPLSNSYFSNAVFPARRNLEAGLRVGLGTDIAGGAEPSMLAQCRHAVTSSRMLEDGVDVDRVAGRGRANSRIDIATAFWMATGGGAELLGIPAGLLAPGKVFDAFSIDLRTLPPAALFSGAAHWEGEADLDPAKRWETTFERVLRSAGPDAIDRVWVGGTDVTPARR